MLKTLRFLAFLWVSLLSGLTWAEDPKPDVQPDESSEEGSLSRTEVVLWEIRANEAATVNAFKQGLREGLAGEAGRHLLDDSAFAKFVEKASPTIPPCLMGLESCGNASALAFDMLGLSLIVLVELENTTSASYRLVDARGEQVRRSEVTAESVRGLAFAVIRDVFDATGTVSFSSTPEGATVEIQGAQVGTTPFVTRLPVGSHNYILRLPRYVPIEGAITARSGLTETVTAELKEMPGYLVVSEAPAGARVYINGAYAGNAGQPIELVPGMYTVEVRAEGYETYRDAAQIQAGSEVRKTAPLAAESGFLKDFGSEAILVNNFMFRLGFEHGFQTLTFQDARNDEYELRSILDESANFPLVGANSSRVTGNGARLDFSYLFEYFGLSLLSLSYRVSSPELPVALLTPNGQTIEGTLSSVQRLQVRPFQLIYRHLYKNVMPFAELGVGIDLQWLDIETVQVELLEPIGLTQTDAFATIGFGAQYFVTPRLFGLFRYSLQAYFEDSHETEHLLYLGVGMALPNLFGLDIEPPDKL